MNKALFSRNKAQIDWENVSYQILPVYDTVIKDMEKKDCKKQIILYNPYDLKVRDDKVGSEILQISRRKVKKCWKKEWWKLS